MTKFTGGFTISNNCDKVADSFQDFKEKSLDDHY